MHSTSVYGLKLSVLEGAGAKALATDNRETINAMEAKLIRCKGLQNIFGDCQVSSRMSYHTNDVLELDFKISYQRSNSKTTSTRAFTIR